MAVKKFFFQKITKNRSAAGGSVPRPPAVIRLSYTTLLNRYPNLDIFAF